MILLSKIRKCGQLLICFTHDFFLIYDLKSKNICIKIEKIKHVVLKRGHSNALISFSLGKLIIPNLLRNISSSQFFSNWAPLCIQFLEGQRNCLISSLAILHLWFPTPIFLFLSCCNTSSLVHVLSLIIQSSGIAVYNANQL